MEAEPAETPNEATKQPRFAWLRAKAAERCRDNFATREAAVRVIKATITIINEVQIRRENIYDLMDVPFAKEGQRQGLADYFSAFGLNGRDRHTRLQNPDWTKNPKYRLTSLLSKIADIISSEEPIEIVIDQIYEIMATFTNEDHKCYWKELQEYDIPALFQELMLNEKPEALPLHSLLLAATFRRSVMHTLTNSEN